MLISFLNIIESHYAKQKYSHEMGALPVGA